MGIGNVVEEVVERGADAEDQGDSTDDGERCQILEIWHEAQGAKEGKEDDDVDTRVHFETREEFDHLEMSNI